MKKPEDSQPKRPQRSKKGEEERRNGRPAQAPNRPVQQAIGGRRKRLIAAARRKKKPEATWKQCYHRQQVVKGGVLGKRLAASNGARHSP